MFARMLQEARKREAEYLESDNDVDSRVENEWLPKLAKQEGASDLVAKVRKLRKEVDDAENALGKLGFDCSEDSISLKWNAPAKLRKALDAAKRSARKERERSFRKFDLAILKIWAAQSADQAKGIVEELL
jgi:hypothetical protein